jgi:MFS family permease
MDRRQAGLAALMGAIHFIFHVFMRLLPPLIPVLTVALAYPLWKLGLLMSVYFAGSSSGLLPMGVLSDRYDRRVTLSGALAVVGSGYVLFGVAPRLGAGLPTVAVAGYVLDGTLLVMGLAMFVSGVGTSAHVPVGVPLLTANASEEFRGTILGVWGGSSKLGDATGPALVGVLILAFGWDSILLGFGIAGIACAAALFLVLSSSAFETRPPDGRADPETGDTRGIDHRHYRYPILVLMGYFAAFNVVVQGTVTFVPTFVSEVYGYAFQFGGVSFEPESFANFALSVLLISAAVGRFAGGVMTDHYDHRTVLVVSLVAAALAGLVFSLASLGPVALMAVLIVFGVALWGNSPARDSLISDISPDDREGRTFSYLWTASRVFGALSPAVLGFMLEPIGIRRSFSYLAVAVVVAALFVSLLFSDRVYAGATSASAAD